MLPTLRLHTKTLILVRLTQVTLRAQLLHLESLVVLPPPTLGVKPLPQRPGASARHLVAPRAVAAVEVFADTLLVRLSWFRVPFSAWITPCQVLFRMPFKPSTATIWRVAVRNLPT